MYSFDSRIRYSEVDFHKNLTLTGIVNYFQDCSTFQSEDLGLGIDALVQMQRAWLLNSWQIIVNRTPAFGEKITISTWPYDFKGFYGYRNFILKDEQDEVCAVANSIWVHIDTTTGRPARALPEIIKAYPNEPRYPMEYADRKVPIPDTLVAQAPFSVVSANIDTNNHVNNGQYVLMAEQYLPEGFEVKEFRVEYRKAARFGDIIYPKVSIEDNLCTIVLADKDDAIFAALMFISK